MENAVTSVVDDSSPPVARGLDDDPMTLAMISEVIGSDLKADSPDAKPPTQLRLRAGMSQGVQVREEQAAASIFNAMTLFAYQGDETTPRG